MRATQHAFLRRGGAVCAAVAVLIGGNFAAGTASAAPSTDSAPSSIATAAASTTATASATETALPDGLAEAVEQDLGKTVEEFNADAEVAAKAADVQAEVTATDPAAVVSVAGDTINITTTAPEAAKAAAGTAKVNVTPVPVSPLVTKQHSDIDTVFADYSKQFGVANLQSIMQDASGNILIRTGDAATAGPASASRSLVAVAKKSTEDFANDYANVVIEAAAGPVRAFATDVTNGQGYVALSGASVFACSIGWNGFDAAGKAAVISAGHCADDGAATATALTNPATEPAAGGPGGDATALLGVFGASQFGGPNNSPVTGDLNGPTTGLGNIGTDVSVIDSINPDVNQLAKVTDWTTPAVPKNSGPVVTGVSAAIVGTDICKSGRTTGWSCAKVDEVGYFFVAGKNYPTAPGACDPVATVPGCADIRGVKGFGSTALVADHGDSGGAIIAGSLAVGMVSAGVPGVISYGVDLKDALAHTAGYSVRIFLAAPKVTTTAPVHPNDTVTGTVEAVPAGTTVSVTIDGVTTEVAIDSDGGWSVAAPNKIGRFTITAQAKNGFSPSEITTASLTVLETLPAPAFTSPALNGTATAPVTAITGTGNAGTTVELDGDVTGTVVVAADGTWSVPATPALAPGIHTVTAKQTLTGWDDSTTTTNKFTVVPAAPAVVSPTKGQEFKFNEGPTVISGTNVEGATVSVAINGKAYDAVVVDGTWSITLDAKLATGDYTISAVQTVDGIASAAGTSVFKVLAEPKPAPATAPAPTKALAAIPAQALVNNNLANTGASGTTLLLGGAGALLLLGGAAVLLIRRRSAK
jgi:LPXTG-motif cell wall-anchored protein